MTAGLTAELTYGVTGAAYLVAAVGLGAWIRGFSGDAKRLGYLLVGMVVLSAASMLLMWQGLGNVPVGGEPLVVPRFIADLVAYPLLFGVTLLIAGCSRRLVLGIVAVMTAMRVGFEVGALSEGVLALAGALTMVLGYGVVLYILWGPGWRVADAQPDGRRLLYWKCRNLIGFLLGMLIVLGVLALFEPTADDFIIEAARQYMDLWIRVGYAIFVFAAVDTLDTFELFEPLRGSTAA